MKPREAIFPFLKLLIRDWSGFLKALLKYTKEAHRKRLFVEAKIHFKTVDIEEIVSPIKEEITHYSYLDGTSRTIDIAFLKALCQKYPECNYLEIGSWRGKSLINTAQVAKKCTSISLSREEMLQMGLSEREADLQRIFTQGIENIVHIEANSHTFDFDQLNEKFDVIFIDGDHSYQGVKSDTINAFKLLRDENSVIVWHDCGFGLEDFRFESISAIMDSCPDEARAKIYRVSNTMCGIYTNQPLSQIGNQRPLIPNKVFTVNIESQPFTK